MADYTNMRFVDFMIYGVLCRLSSDLYTIDDSLPFIMNILLANFVGLLGIAIILSYVQVGIHNYSWLFLRTMRFWSLY